MIPPADACDILRIIAGEDRLTDADRACIRDAADQLEFAQRDLISAYARLIEVQNKLIAVNDQLLAARRSQWSMSSGWVSCT